MQSKEKRRKVRQARKAWIAVFKSVPCMDCGNTFPPECMDFDHVRGVKKFRISYCLTSSEKVLLAEMAKCEIVCSNCHRIRTRIRRLSNETK